MKAFFSLIDQMNRRPEQAAELENLIWQTFGADKAVLALDMSGFSLTVRRDGILAYLRKIRLMQDVTLPLIRQHQGDVVKCEADNLMVTFDDCNDAVAAASAIRQACLDIRQEVSIGLDYGHILLIPDTDCYGDAVNLAFKLGEDIARNNEILLTDEVHKRLSRDQVSCEEQHVSISGLQLSCWRLLSMV
ncbi:MAG: adenylate/guanylate cyclase domain-containing protein [Fluviicoccus sp.]|uniref:adenylate/guanylate cyclase domain-containing protein n=1 Tax=Fluviicoccus sp. TaxID=2003552 RepID=UPI002721B041|nr:adenylate/guanylate cyclase domain-containing protein [Fluviicoccus sp.]MDO8329013.1 adenylate/guanylate cyclase domain-containing protein [Fluviicoccus sp.]